MALTASTPFYRGIISDVDCRWKVLSMSVDDRTTGERGETSLKTGEQLINKSRYDSIDCFISNCNKELNEKWNDVELPIDYSTYKVLKDNNLDKRLARHIAHLYIRDPLVIYKERIEIDDKSTTEHFENIQSTNWQNVRFKPPPFNSNIGWRVEFRTMEIQLTEFENAAFVIFITLLNRAIIYFKLNLYTYISQTHINMERAQLRDAILKKKFWFKLPKIGATENSKYEPKIEELKISEIICGTKNHPGLAKIVSLYLDKIGCKGQTRECINSYIKFVKGRATCQLKTNAAYLRNFVQNHPLYDQDSILHSTIVRDLFQRIDEIVHGQSGDIKLGEPFYCAKSLLSPSSDSIEKNNSSSYKVI